MASNEYDAIFVGGGLAATLLVNALRPGNPERSAVIERWPLSERPPVHWSYWSREPTPLRPVRSRRMAVRQGGGRTA